MSRRWYRLAAAVLAPLIFLVLLEAGLRIFGYSYDPTRELAGREHREEFTRPELYRPHPRYLWTLLPESRLDHPPLGFFGARTNSLGLRGNEVPTAKKPGELLVLCLGDSVVFGLGLEDDETVPARLQEALNEKATGDRTVRVLNAGVPGWSSVSGLRLYEDLAALDPDVVVFWFGMNDAKQHLGIPDGSMRVGEGTIRGAPRGEFRIIQLLRSLSVGVRRSMGDRTRVSAAEYRAAVEKLRASGTHVLFVRYPERMEQTIGELRRIGDRAREERVQWIVGPGVTLTPLAPAPKGFDFDLRGVRVETSKGPALRLSGPDRTLTLALEVFDQDRVRLEELMKNLQVLLATLPEDSLTYRDLFGDADPDDVFADNCHLTKEGARLAGRALAERVRLLTAR